jgi:hypothetical protein
MTRVRRVVLFAWHLYHVHYSFIASRALWLMPAISCLESCGGAAVQVNYYSTIVITPGCYVDVLRDDNASIRATS